MFSSFQVCPWELKRSKDNHEDPIPGVVDSIQRIRAPFVGEGGGGLGAEKMTVTNGSSTNGAHGNGTDPVT